ncbi:O-antigen ligase family protein [Amnibacterium setariae]|uniref:O-antigen ligase domain-containing protein n=1 Tax=Amnibacterium setariae TaxID=2306585 RepID=A0A3A1TTB9_9MICO|nr:O-antigen ligase family protein [Amnibacterium setariae]RIX26603.1 O-antigen ligase domain-containing protein [Amnibacterium setariae]
MTKLAEPRTSGPRDADGRAVTRWIRAELLTWPAVEKRDGGWRRAVARAAVVAVALGLMTESWDRFLNVEALGYNLKLPSLLFSIAAIALVVAVRHPIRLVLQRAFQRYTVVLTAAIVLYLAVRGVFTTSPLAASAQLAAVLSGAVLPFVALLLVLRTRRDLLWAISWLSLGAAVAAAFGVYQLIAFYAGLPQGIEYSGVSIGTGLGRISSFSYEPAYFSYFVILVLGAVVARRRMLGGEVSWPTLGVFGAVLYLINVRAAPLMVVAVGGLLLLAFSSYRRLIARGAIVLVCATVVALAVPVLIAQISTAGGQTSNASIPTDRFRSPATETTQPSETSTSPAAATPAPAPSESAAPETGVGEPLQAFDPNEQSSNSPRLELYKAVLATVGRSPVFGVGPGNLGPVLQRDAPGAIANQGAQVVANNIWLQALADGGIPLLLMEMAVIGGVAVAGVRRRRFFTYPLVAAWLSVLLVGGMLTSYFFDIKVWVALGLLVAGVRVVDLERQAGTTPRQPLM